MVQLVKDTMAFIAGFEGDIPCAQESKECGNYLDHDLAKAKAYAKAYGQAMNDWNEEQLVYPQ